MSDSNPTAGLDFSMGYDPGSAPSPGINNGTTSSYGGGAGGSVSPTTYDLGAIDSLAGYGLSLDVGAAASIQQQTGVHIDFNEVAAAASSG